MSFNTPSANKFCGDSTASESGYESSCNGEDIPSDFICPITLQVMVRPVFSRSGVSFERSAILDWLGKGSNVCPLTRKPLKPSDLIPNHALEVKISAWRLERGLTDLTIGDVDKEEGLAAAFLPVTKRQFRKLTSPEKGKKSKKSKKKKRSSSSRSSERKPSSRWASVA